MPEEEKKEQIKKKCIVYFKTGFLRGVFFGERFDSLDSCCAIFEEVFLHTGNDKSTSWDKNTLLNRVETGLNFVKQESKLMVFFCGKPIKFCSWCGQAVDVQERRNVLLERKFKTVPDGYQEIAPGEGRDK